MPTVRTASRQTTLGKLRRPRLGRVFERERLLADLDAGAAAPGAWIAAPPGMDKTTVVATYLQAEDREFKRPFSHAWPHQPRHPTPLSAGL